MISRYGPSMSNGKKTNYLETVYTKEKKPLTKYPEQLARMLSRKYIGMENQMLLDVGCGRGEMARCLSKYYKVEAVDNSEYNHGSEYKFTMMDISEPLKLEEKNYDIVFSKSVIEHFSNPLSLIEEMFRILKPGGKIVCLTPDWETQYRNFYNDCTHLRPFSKKSLDDILRMAGFENVNIDKIYQLPFTWGSPMLKIIPKVISTLTPYPIYSYSKLTRFSQERMLVGIATKPL